MSARIVAIAGVNGKLATLIVKHLLENYPEIKIHGIARSPEKVDAAVRDSPNVEIFEASASNTSALRQGLKGAEAAICCYLGNNELMTEGQKTLIDACIDEKVARCIASDWSFDYRGLELGDHPTKDPMIHINSYLEEKEKSGKIKAVHVLNGSFMEVVMGPFNPFFQPKAQVYQYWGTGDEPMEMTTYSDAAVFTAEIAADPSAVGFLNILGDRKSAKQVAEAYERVYEEKLELECLGSMDDLKSKMTATFQQVPEEPYKWIAMYYLFHMCSGKLWLKPLHTSRYPGVKPRDVEAYFKSRSKESLSSLH